MRKHVLGQQGRAVSQQSTSASRVQVRAATTSGRDQPVADNGVRASGVTPVLRQDYAGRTAERQAAFVRPYLSSGLELLDVGCGPGTITVGLAARVAPGRVVGLDHDPTHVAMARTLAQERGLDNATFEDGDATTLPYEDDRFDVAFENDVFVHLGSHAVTAAREIHRVLRPSGIFAARDAVVDAALWANQTEPMREFDKLFFRWQAGRGSDLNLGRGLPRIVREAGFEVIGISVSADTKGTEPEVKEHARRMLSLLDGPVGHDAKARGAVDGDGVDRMAAAIRRWGSRPDSFFANVHVEVIGRKAT